MAALGDPKCKLILTNASGLVSKLGEFQHVVTTHLPDIAIVTETKFTAEKCTIVDAMLPGSQPPIRRDRTSQGGDVAVWLRSSLAYRHLQHVSCGYMEVIWITVQLQSGSNVVVCAAYRPGTCSDSDISMIEHIDSTIDRVRRQESDIIIAGDFNVHNRAWLHSTRTSVAGEAAEDMCALHGLIQHVLEPTRDANTLDLVMTDFQDHVHIQVLPPIGKSDHAVIIATCSSQLLKEKSTRRTVWRYKKADWPRLQHFYRTTDWDALHSPDVDECTRAATSHILLGMQKFIPSRRLVACPSDKPWWTPECSDAVKEKQRAWRHWRSQPCVANQSTYKIACTNACLRISAAKSIHRQRLRARLQAGCANDKEWWKTLKQANGHGRNSGIPTIIDREGN